MWAHRAAARARQQRQQKDDQMKRQGRLWVASVAALMVGFVLVTGQYISFGSQEYEGDEGDDEAE